MRTAHRSLRGFLALTVATLLVAPSAWSAPIIETLGEGSGIVDWTKGTLTVTGSGSPPDSGSLAQKRLLAKRAAEVDGYRQLAEVITGVRVDSETVVKDFAIESDLIRTQVNALVKGAKAGEPQYLSDGSVEIEMTVSLYGPSSVFAAVDFDHKIAKPIPQPSADTTAEDSPADKPQTDTTAEDAPADKPHAEATPKPAPTPKPRTSAQPQVVPSANPDEETPVELTRPAPKPTPAAKPSAEAGQPGAVSAPTRPDAKPPAADAYTGLIIDCRDLAVQPAMSPAILDEAGKELYVGKMPIDPDAVIASGIVGYASNLNEATDDVERVGKNPLIIKAKKASGQYKADVVLGTADAADVLKANDGGQFLAKSRVLFIVRP